MQVVPMAVDSAGRVKTDAILGHSSDKKVFSHFTDLVERQPDDEELVRPSEEELTETTARTRAVLEKLVNGTPHFIPISINNHTSHSENTSCTALCTSI